MRPPWLFRRRRRRRRAAFCFLQSRRDRQAIHTHSDRFRRRDSRCSDMRSFRSRPHRIPRLSLQGYLLSQRGLPQEHRGTLRRQAPPEERS